MQMAIQLVKLYKLFEVVTKLLNATTLNIKETGSPCHGKESGDKVTYFMTNTPGEVRFIDVDEGTYLLEEQNPPSLYIATGDKWVVKIASDGGTDHINN
jgi:hypothetical protein